MSDLIQLTGLSPGSSILVLGERAADELRLAGCRVALAGRAGSIPASAGPFDAAVLDDLPGSGTDLESLLADVVQAVRPGGLVVLRVRDGDPGVPSRDELCAHFAGELLGVDEQREERIEGNPRTIWLLRVPGGDPSPGGDR